MTTEAAELWQDQDIVPHLCRDGFVLLPNWHQDRATIDIARLIGTVLEVHALLPRSGIPTVQTLKARCKTESLVNQYSGTFGLGDFPLHTDLAHWARPPHYFVLRCIKGVSSVMTRLLPSSELESTLGTAMLRRALVRPRHSRRTNCALPLMFRGSGTFGLRWDSIFIVPINESARRLAKFMSAGAWDQSKQVEVALTNHGDTLIVDNWRILHGRSSVPTTEIERRLERVYLSELHT